MTRHEFFKDRLRDMGFYDKDSDYGGLIGKWVEELSKLFSEQGHSGASAVITNRVFNQLLKEWNGPLTGSS